MAGSLGIIFVVLTQLAAAGLILLMLGAIQKKCSFGTPDSEAKGARAGIMT